MSDVYPKRTCFQTMPTQTMSTQIWIWTSLGLLFPNHCFLLFFSTSFQWENMQQSVSKVASVETACQSSPNRKSRISEVHGVPFGSFWSIGWYRKQCWETLCCFFFHFSWFCLLKLLETGILTVLTVPWIVPCSIRIGFTWLQSSSGLC